MLNKNLNGYCPISTLKSELSEIINEIGFFPTQKQLRQFGRNDITKAISNLGLTFYELQKELGFVPKERPKGFWKKWENMENLIKPHIKDGRFPTQTELVQTIKGGIGDAIAYFGGIAAVADRMGYKLDYRYKATDGHFLDSLYELIFDEYLYSNSIPHEVNQCIHESSNCRYDFKIGNIYVEIWGYEVGRTNSERCERYNEKRIRKEELYQALGLRMIAIDADVFKGSASEINSHFDKIIQENNIKDIVNTESEIVIQNTIKSNCYWNEDTIKEELSKLLHQLDKMPTQQELLDLKLGGLKDAISRHGGIHYFAELLNTECKRKPEGHWTDETIVAMIKKFIDENDNFPTFNELEKIKQYDLIRAINRNGGLPKFRKLLNCPELCKPHNYYTEELIYNKIKDFANKIGHFPTYNELRREEKTLCSALDRYKLSIVTLRNKYNSEKS